MTTSSHPSRAALQEGLRTLSAAHMGVAAWGLVTGIAMVKSGLTVPQAIGMTMTVYAGSAQLAALPLIAADAPFWVVMLSAIMVNLRFVIYSARVAPHFRHLPLRWRLLTGYFTADISMVIAMPRIEARPGWHDAHWFHLGCGIAGWIPWQIASLVGILLASQIPTTWGLGFAGTLALVALAIPLINNLPATLGVCGAIAIAVLCFAWPYKLGLVAAILGGIAIALLTENIGTGKNAGKSAQGSAA